MPRITGYSDGSLGEDDRLIADGPDGSKAITRQEARGWVALTQTEYDELDPPDPDTLYIIVEE